MNRREIIKSGILATGTVLSSGLMGFQPRISLTNNDKHSTLRLDIGKLETYILSDGIVSLDNIQPVFAPHISSGTVNRELERLHIRESKPEAGINVLLIKKERKKVLLDTGAGIHMGANAGRLIGALDTLNIQPADITDIIISHAHLDHIGGIINQQDKIIFPSAQYHIAEKEYEFWVSEQGSPGNEGSISFAQNVLHKIKDRLNFFQYGDTLFSCLKSELAEGHTKGHTIFTIFSDEKSVKHIVDTFHTPLLIARPEWGTQWDADFDKAVKTRQRIIEEGIRDRTLFMGCHLPWPGLGYIDQVNGSPHWSISPYANPSRITL